MYALPSKYVAGKTHHAKRLGHLPFEEQVVQRGNELAHGEIAARAKDHTIVQGSSALRSFCNPGMLIRLGWE
jgi:hypothetical protein